MTPLRLLFLGNSYTMNQSLDATVAAMIQEASGETVQEAKLTAGGLTFVNHVERAEGGHSDWMGALANDASQWDWVFLQEQSQIPGFPEDNTYVQDSITAAAALCDLAAAREAQSVFVMTWGRRSGDTDNPDRYPDFTTMQDHLTAGYLRYVETCATPERPTWVAPVGLAWRHIHDGILADGGDPQDESSLFYRLYSTDGSHPSPSGNHLAAAVIYATLTGESPVGLSDPSGLVSPDDAAQLQAAAAAVVLGESPDIDYPWEVSEETPEDTGEPTDTGETSEDTGEPTDTGETDTSDNAEETPSGNASAEESGCRSRSALLLPPLFLMLLGLRRR